METTNKKWHVHETDSMFQLISPEKEVVAEYFYLNGTLKEQDKLQAQYHEIAAKLNCHNELVGALRKIVERERAFIEGEGKSRIEAWLLTAAEAALKKAETL